MPLKHLYTLDNDSEWPNRSISADQGPPVRLAHEGSIDASLWQQSAPFLAEFVGTFVLTMTFLCNYTDSGDTTWAVTSNAFMVMVLMYAFGHISGANLNPSVSVALLLAGRQSFRTTCGFWMAQILGSSTAAVLRHSILSQQKLQSTVTLDFGPKPHSNWTQVGTVEVLYTAMVCFVYLNCAASRRNNPLRDQNGFVGLSVGLCFIAGGYAARSVSNTVMNVAIAIGLGIVDNFNGFSWTVLGYVVYDILGAFLGAYFYRIVRRQEFKDPDRVDYKDEDHEVSARVAAEFIGTFYVVLTKALNRMHSEGPEAWSVGAALSAMVYALRDVSGAHFNPAVTLSVWTSRRGLIEARMAVFHCLVQIFAGCLATTFLLSFKRNADLTIKFDHSHSRAANMLSEALFSFLACYVVLSTGTVEPVRSKTAQNNVAGFAYGGVHTVAGFAIRQISGCMLNPAVVIGFSEYDVIRGGLGGNCMQYIFYQVAGGLFASAAFALTHPGLYRQALEPSKGEPAAAGSECSAQQA